MDREITDFISEEKAKKLLKKMFNQEFSVLVEDIEKLKAELQKRDEVENRLREQIRYYQAMLFGKKSEKRIYQPDSGPVQPELDFGDQEPSEEKPETSLPEEP